MTLVIILSPVNKQKAKTTSEIKQELAIDIKGELGGGVSEREKEGR